MKQVLKVKDLYTHEEVHEVDVSGKSAAVVERVLSGMLVNLNRERFFVDDSEAYPPEETERAGRERV